jgi:hypothetical protein
MIIRKIWTPDQDVVVTAEGGDVAVLHFFGDTRIEGLDFPDGVIHLSLSEAEQLATALVEAVERTRAAA